MSFPSDTVTVRDIRRRDATVFQRSHHGMDSRLDELSAIDALGTEMDVAGCAFDRATGLKGLAYGELTRDDLVRHLLDTYARLRIGDGERSRLELVRKIEADAIAQAKIAIGRGK